MPNVEIRWRPSGGRGEYEHVPQEILLERNIVIDCTSVPGGRIRSDVWGKIRDGKPRIRRENQHDRSLLNVPNLVAALALLPDPQREDKGEVVLPLKEKAYVVSVISFVCTHADNQRAICRPTRLRVLHDNNQIDLIDRMMRIGKFLSRTDLPSNVRSMTDRYRQIVKSGIPSVELRTVANQVMAWLTDHPQEAFAIEAPSERFTNDTDDLSKVSIELVKLTADETKRRMTSHFTIERSRKIRRAKVTLFENTNGGIFCENCIFDFGKRFGERGEGFIEVHHKLPLAALLPNSITSLDDLMLLCSNCHRIVHRKSPLLAPSDLRAITRLDILQ